jgi:murein DD-endopeptidase MepM/ murein hydrolase activator NlpD
MKKSRIIKNISRILCLALALVGVCAFLPASFDNTAVAATISDATTKAYEEQIERINAQQRELEQKLAALKDEKNSAISQKKLIDQAIGLTNNKIEATEKLISQLIENIGQKGQAIAVKEGQIAQQYEYLLGRIRASYETGNASYLEMLIGSESFGDFLARSERITSILEYDKRLMDEYEAAKKALEDEKASLEESKRKQDEYEASLEAEKSKLDKQLNDSQSYINSLSNQQDQVEELYEKAQAEEKKLDEELQAYIKEQQALLNAEYVGGELGWPLPAANNYVTSSFGWRTYEWFGSMKTDYHRGIDLRASTGTDIYACNAGEVMISTYHSSYGYYILIDHGGGKATLYAHCSKLYVSAGDTVKKGQLIALSGATGNVNGPHLHFEVRINGEVKNPLDYVTRPQ